MDNGAILYEGPSKIDGKPIIAILTGLAKNSSNTKTGAMLQTWIIRSDIAPHNAQATGDDISVCGSCLQRPAMKTLREKLAKLLGVSRRQCYVKTFHAPRSVYEAYHRGNYQHLEDIDQDDLIDAIGERMLRIGSYGDPMAISADVWITILKYCGYPKTTGYTHQWKRPGASAYASFCMASCDLESDIPKAKRLGFRTALIGERSTCPAQLKPEKYTCSTCAFCDGTTGDVVFANH